MACLDLRRDRLFQRVAQRPSPPKAVQQGQSFLHRTFPSFGPFSFCAVPANELLILVFRYSDSGHHADASLPVLWRRKCFLVTCFSCDAPRTMPCSVRPSSAANAIQATLWAALLTEETSLFLSDAHV